MIRVVIVEDEMLVRLGMKMSLENAKNGISVTAAFESAEEALTFFESNTADVLITDIRLAGISGLDLVERLSAAECGMTLVVLSCYEDFSYARRAYELGVDKYILKHELREDQLPMLVNELYLEKRAKHAADGAFAERPTFARQPEERPGCHYRLGYVQLCGRDEAEPLSGADLSFPMAAEIIGELLTREQLGQCFLRHDEELFCVFSLELNTPEAEVRRRLQTFCERLGKNLLNYFNRTAFLVVSAPFDDLRAAVPTYDKLKRQADYTFYMKTPGLLWAEELPPAKAEFIGSVAALVPDTRNVFTDAWLERYTATIRTFFETCERARLPPNELRVAVVRFVHEWATFLEKYYEIDLNDIAPKDLRPNYISVNSFKNSQSLCEWLIRLGRESGEYVAAAGKRETTIAKILAYTQENYRSSLTLAGIAETFHMNTGYVCQLFKKKTGVTFINYLNRLRIEKAKALLSTTGLSAEQTAERVGIGNANYFFRLFKKLTGKTVGQYRAEHRQAAAKDKEA